MFSILRFFMVWIFRAVVIKFVLFTGMFLLVTFLAPYAVGYLLGFIKTSYLDNAFAVLPAGLYYFLDYFRLDFGLPLTISALVSRFLIRRLPVIG